jgi:hypothetical protein
MNLITQAYAQGPVQIKDNFGFGYFTDFGSALGALVPVTFFIMTILVVFHFLVGAYEMIISGGDKNRVAEARSKITQSIVGFILLIFAFLVVPYMLEAMGLGCSGTFCLRVIK